MPRRLSTLALVAALSAPAFAQLTPEKALATLKAGDGLQVELFASEPMLLNPTSMDVDHLGRVWVCEAVNYRRKLFNRPMLRKEGDRIVILTDTNADGKADESTVFYQGEDLYGPLGIAVAKDATGPGYKVFVCQSPDILLFEDKDGDAKADGPPKKFLTGFSGFDHDHGVHSILIGPDGKLYFTVGDAGVKGLQSSDGKGRKWETNRTDCQAGTVWRCDFDGTDLELIAHNFRNNYECCVNSFGEIWLSDNDDDGNQQTRICHVMPGGNYGYWPRGPGQTHWHEEQPGVVHKTLRTGFGSPTGICFYEGSLLPEKYRGQLLHTDAGPRELRCFHIKPKGAGYELTKENLLTSTDNWFRPSDVCVAPDGSVFVCDWYDPGVGGHGMGDWTRGRVYRVTPKGHKGYKVPTVKLDSYGGVMEMLGSPCRATRALAQDKLRTLTEEEYRRLILAEGKPSRPNPTFLARMVALTPGLKTTTSDKWLVANNPFDKKVEEPYRILYLRTLNAYSHVVSKERWKQLADKFRASGDGITEAPGYSTPIGRELLLLLRKIDDLEAVKPTFYAIAKKYDGKDHFYRAALNIACGTDPKRRDAILADFDKHFPEWNDKVADLVWELRPKSVLPRLEKLLADPKLSAVQKGRIVDILAVTDDPAAGKAMLALLSGDHPPEITARALENLRLFLPGKWRKLRTGQELSTAIDALLKEEKSIATALQLIAIAGSRDRIDAVVKVARDAKAPLEVRKEAIQTLGKLRDAKSVDALLELGSTDNSLTLARIHALGDLLPQGPNAPEYSGLAPFALARVVRLAGNDGVTPEQSAACLATLAGNRAGTIWLLDAHSKGELPKAVIAEAGRLLRNSPYQDLRNRALIAFPAPARIDLARLPSIAELAKRKGSAQRGKEIMAKSLTGEAQCLKCHTVRGVGGSIGPDLSMIGKKGSRENLFESILQPSKAIADQHVSWKIDTLDGQTITGLLVAETPATLTVRDANGKDHAIPVKDIDRKSRSLLSLMPDNLAAALTEDELVDLVEYMTTLQTAALTPEAWHVAGPFPGGANNVGLDVEHGPGKLPFDPKAKFGAVTWRTVRPDATGYVDLAALHGQAAADSVSYLYAAVESPAEQDADILLGTDDGATLSVNGEQVYVEKVTRAAAPGQARVPVKLKAGTNVLLLKIANGDGPHGCYLTILSGQELKPKP